MCDSYLKYLKKKQASTTQIRPYAHADKLTFLNKIYNVPASEDLPESSINFVEVPCKDFSDEIHSDHGNNSANSEKREEPPLKISKIETVEPENNSNGNEERHMTFFKGLLNSLSAMTEGEIIEFQMGVLELIINIKRNRLQFN